MNNRLNIVLPFESDSNSNIKKKIIGDSGSIKFSIKHKLYYNLIRKFIPTSLKRRVQNFYYKDIKFNNDFIFNDYKDTSDYININYGTLFPDNKKTAIILTHDVEDIKGLKNIPKILEVEKKYGFQSSWNIVPYKYNIDNKIIDYIQSCGCEIGIHGYNHDGKLYYSEKIFEKRTYWINKAIEEYNAVGFRSPLMHRNLYWLQKLNIEYDSSTFDYDPYQPFPGGTGMIFPFIAGKFVELPYTLPQDHTLFYVLKVKNIDIWKNKIDWIVKNNGMILLLTHPDYLTEKNHLNYYEELLSYLKQIKNSWHCLPKEISFYWKKMFSLDL